MAKLSRTPGLKTHIWNNNLRSMMLIATYPLLMIFIVWLCAALAGGLMGAPTGMDGPDQMQVAAGFANNIIAAYWPMIVTVIAIWFLISFFFHGRMVRMLSHAKPVTRLQEPGLYNLLENLCISRGLPMPRLEIIETDALNAFASGIDRTSYAVTVTRGLMNNLAPDELEAVLAHELTHIINHDVRLLIISVIFTGMIGFAAQLVWSNVRYNALMGGRNRDQRGVMLLLAIALILWIGHFLTTLTRFALSRRREFMADAGAVELTRKPEAMMRALLKISGRDRIPAAPVDIAMMCIENSAPFMGLFATHPPIEARIRAIAATTDTQIPNLSAAPQAQDSFRSPWG